MSRREASSHGAFHAFVHSEVAGSVVLLAATITALVWANSPWAEIYQKLTHTYVGVSWGDAAFRMSLQHWVNDGLMVIFFFVVGLEIKREMVLGELASLRQAILPVSAAIGGMLLPAAFYFALNPSGPAAGGWGIPMATDIAFALGILALLGSRVPIGLKVFLTALAIVDDLGAVAVIAIFYTEKIRIGALVAAGVLLVALVAASRLGVRRVGLYAALVLGVWAAVFSSGVHATVAGILVAMLVPVQGRIDPRDFLARARQGLAGLERNAPTRESLLADDDQLETIGDVARNAAGALPPGLLLERYLHPFQSFVILPLFALFNAGVPLSGGIREALAGPVSLGVAIGLVAGKPLGIALSSWLAVRSGGGALPAGVRWSHLWGAGCLAGVGFTMSLFISELAFSASGPVREAKLGILAASLVSGIVGLLVLHRTLPRR